MHGSTLLRLQFRRPRFLSDGELPRGIDPTLDFIRTAHNSAAQTENFQPTIFLSVAARDADFFCHKVFTIFNDYKSIGLKNQAILSGFDRQLENIPRLTDNEYVVVLFKAVVGHGRGVDAVAVFDCYYVYLVLLAHVEFHNGSALPLL